eukprot:7168475-Pyramimonas_sp.AAC.1
MTNTDIKLLVQLPTDLFMPSLLTQHMNNKVSRKDANSWATRWRWAPRAAASACIPKRRMTSPSS